VGPRHSVNFINCAD